MFYPNISVPLETWTDRKDRFAFKNWDAVAKQVKSDLRFYLDEKMQEAALELTHEAKRDLAFSQQFIPSNYERTQMNFRIRLGNQPHLYPSLGYGLKQTFEDEWDSGLCLKRMVQDQDEHLFFKCWAITLAYLNLGGTQRAVAADYIDKSHMKLNALLDGYTRKAIQDKKFKYEVAVEMGLATQKRLREADRPRCAGALAGSIYDLTPSAASYGHQTVANVATEVISYL